MFHYLHCYMPETWDAQVREGLVNENGGIRFSQSIDIPEPSKFNNLAKKDGKLYSIVKELRCPFYIDRLQGGCFFEGYDYDMELIAEYRELLGENFWGFQMHEWMSNAVSDIHKLTSNHCPEPWTEQGIRETLLRAFPYAHVFIEAMNEREMAQMGHVTDVEPYLAFMRSLFQKRQDYTGGALIPADSAFLAPQIELSLGAKRLMPEIGKQTHDTRIQIAYTRGMTKAAGVPFGTYYEPWGGEPFSACNYQRDGKNEWNIDNASFPFKTAGGKGGSSRSLQKRMHLYSFVAGAQFMAEEWGMCNTFYDWQDFALTPYGQVKKDFIRFTEKYADIGEMLTPVAVVLPTELPVLNNIRECGGSYLGFPVDAARAARLNTIRKAMFSIFCDSAPMCGTETENLLNYVVPDAVDIVNADYLHAENYTYLVDLTGDPAFSKAHPNCIEPAQVRPMLEKLLPCTVEGDLHFVVNRAPQDGYYLTIFNHSGVERTVEKGEVLLPQAEKTVTVTVKENRPLVQKEGDGTICRNDGKYQITVPAGGWFFGTF